MGSVKIAMLSFLTGPVQTGKTRWLVKHIEAFVADGGLACGVISPGMWIDHGEGAGDGRYEKTGIEAVLLPSHEAVPFALRKDLAVSIEGSRGNSQSARANLGWSIDDMAIARINAHFAELAALVEPARRLLIIDELGVLEIERGEGFTQAISLIDRGATPAIPDALVVVRESLIECALERFSAAQWNGIEMLRME